MRKRFSVLSCILFACALCSCSVQDSSHSDRQEPVSSPVDSSPAAGDSSDSAPNDSNSDSTNTNSDSVSSLDESSDSQLSEDIASLTRYASIYDVPYAELDYDRGHHFLTKDGKPWVGTPGTDQFGEICFSDGHNFYIQCFLSYNDTLSTDFRWFCANFNHFDDERTVFLPDETMNQLFAGADGDTLYTDDGYRYKLSTMPWCQDGTCKR